MKHIKVEILANEQQQEELIAVLNDYNALGFEQTDETLLTYFVQDEYLAEDVNKILDGYQYKVSQLEEQNWNLLWEKSFHPVIVDDFCAVRAHFHKQIYNVSYEIIITPKMSFGTGHHATTYMMIEQMRNIDFTDKKVFDFGTGTGILAILAEKLGATRVVAIDVDEWSIENAKENLERNHCGRVNVELSSMIPRKQFDIILANINRNVIIKYLPDLNKRMKPEGLILISGLLTTDEGDVIVASTSNDLRPIKRLERSGWVSLLLTNNP